MATDLEHDMLLGDVRYRNMGLIGNPFLRYELDDAVGIGLVSHAEATGLVSALDDESCRDRPRPVWVKKFMPTAEYYHTVAVSEVLRSLAKPDTPILGVYMPLDFFRMGRFRGALGSASDAVSARQFDETLAAWAADVLTAPDTELEEYAGIAPLDLPALVERLQTSPNETVAEYFGEFKFERQTESAADVRQSAAYRTEEHLDRDPVEGADADEMDGDLAAAAPPDLGMIIEQPAEDEEAVEEATPAVAEYLIAYARAHVSPVIARAIQGYIIGGAAGVSEQLKITKAPKKTLKALMSFVSHRYRKLVLIYDRFDPWDEIEDEGRALVLGTLSELRWLMADHGILVMLVTEGLAPDLEEQFGGARRVDWTLRGLVEMSAKDTPLDADLVQSWIDAAALGDTAPFTVDGPELAPILKAADGLLVPFATMAAAAIDDAANRGCSALDEAAIAAGLAQNATD